MKKYLLILLLLGTQLCGLPLHAQKKAKNAVAKEMAAEQKRLETEGWKLWNSNETWQELLTKKYAMLSEQIVDEDGESLNRYIVCTASAEHRSLNTAMQLAETKAKSDIASKQKTDVDVTTVQMNKTRTADNSIVDSEDRTGTAINKHSGAKMNKVEKLSTIYRKTEKDVYVVEVCMALDMQKE